MTTLQVESRRKILILGLDGVTWDVLRPLMDEGRMPHLRGVVEEGASGVLRSTTPPITPAAWTTFLTGKQPGRHGIIDFERYDPPTNRLAFNSTRCLDHVRNLWQILGDQGLRVGSVNVPMTYPASPVNGFLVSGFETPGPDSDFVHPPELRSEILARWPDPTLRAKWRRSAVRGDSVFIENLNYISRSFHLGASMTMWLGERFGWDALMVVLKLTDNLQHKTWKYLDPRWSGRNPKRGELARDCFAEADRAVGTLLEYADANNAIVLIVSDHGHGSLEGKIHVNRLLQQWGYLVLRGGGAQGTTRVRLAWDRLRGKTKRFAREGNIADDLAVDFDRTRACVMHAGMAGFLYINLAGRQPCGIVKPSDYELLREEIRERLLGEEGQINDPNGRTIRLFTEVHRPEELYGCSRDDQPWMPDLILIPHDSLAVVRKIRGTSVVNWLPYSKIEGTHRPDGVIAARGPGIARRADLRTHIVHCAPTVLALMGVPIPNDMDGRVIEELFESLPAVRYESAGILASATARVQTTSPANNEAYSETELEKVTERLSELGYLE